MVWTHSCSTHQFEVGDHWGILFQSRDDALAARLLLNYEIAYNRAYIDEIGDGLNRVDDAMDGALMDALHQTACDNWYFGRSILKLALSRRKRRTR